MKQILEANTSTPRPRISKAPVELVPFFTSGLIHDCVINLRTEFHDMSPRLQRIHGNVRVLNSMGKRYGPRSSRFRRRNKYEY